ncbi:NUDIX domain-containing protein [Thalassobacillus hwangdonensis]|uniref:NUDIX domain-containing protein n=1 Tax=Thalassobacillus hwangdonensis TaxID=546108 RepID=A0ABW3L2B4_9BACI
MPIRNSVKAIITEGDSVLLTKNMDKEGAFYLFPGGGQEHEETMHDALRRECMEEAGIPVQVNELLYVREYIGKDHEHADFDSGVHQIEYYFLCEQNPEMLKSEPTNPDDHQIGIEWVSIADLHHYRIYPNAMVSSLVDYFIKNQPGPVYLGNIN